MLGVSVVFKVKTASAKLWGIVSIISLGVIIASYGEIDFDLLGFSVQVRPRFRSSLKTPVLRILRVTDRCRAMVLSASTAACDHD